jgi:hypothetical protein
MASKRVSLKGKGADLFFGDYTPSQASGQDSGQDSGVAATNGPSTTEAVMPQSGESATPPPSAKLSPIEPAVAPRATRRPIRRASGRTQAPDDSDAMTSNSKLASKLARQRADEQASDDRELVDAIRKVVKVPGREVSFVRLTPEEKAQLTDIMYTYKRQGMKTTETEINRIALNYLLHDYHEHGEHSVLARVLAALLA